jgi:NitT/TauT family transport system ATP-binding protein
MALLTLSDVDKSFVVRRNAEDEEIHALAGVNFEVEEGEFLAIIGASGCGKSTLLRIIDGLLPPTRGQVLLHGRAVDSPGPDRGVVFQQSNLLPWRTVLRNVEFGLECQGVGTRERRERARGYVEMVGLAGFERYYPGQLSGGMQQRVGLARAFATEPEILLLDEPFGALDAQTRVLLQGELERIWSEHRRTAILVTHDIEEAIYLADRVLVMSSRPGRVKEVVSIGFPRPRSDAVRSDPAFAELKGRLWEALRPETKL